MPLPLSSTLPGIAAILYTAPPRQVIYDMYENELTFDEATQNLYDKEMEAGWNTDMLDEFLVEDGGEIDGLDSDDVDKTIYQRGIEKSQGTPFVGTMTPYGPALTQERMDEVELIYPGLGAIDDFRGTEEQMAEAERFLENIGVSQGIDNLLDGATTVAEDTGQIDNLGSIVTAGATTLGNFVGNMWGNTDWNPFDADIAYASTGNQATNIGNNLGTQNRIDPSNEFELDAAMAGYFETQGPVATPSSTNQPTVIGEGDWAKIPGTANTTPAVVSPANPLNPEQPPGQNDEPGTELLPEFQKLLVGETTAERIMFNIQKLDRELNNNALVNDALGLWMAMPNWNSEIRDSGADPATLTEYILRVFSSPTRNYIDDFTKITTGSGDGTGVVTTKKTPDGTPPIVTVTGDGTKKKTTVNVSGAVGPALTTAQARNAHLEQDLKQTFYQTVWAQPWGGRAEFQSRLPTMFSETKTLFLMNAGIKGFSDMAKLAKKDETTGESHLTTAYKDFVERYLKNPMQYRAGEDFRNTVNLIKRVLELIEKDRTEKGKEWDDAAKNARDWVQALFGFEQGSQGDESLATTNRNNILRLMVTGGRQGRIENMFYNQAIRRAEDFRIMGLNEREIFDRQAVRTGWHIDAPATTGDRNPYSYRPVPTTYEEGGGRTPLGTAQTSEQQDYGHLFQTTPGGGSSQNLTGTSKTSGSAQRNPFISYNPGSGTGPTTPEEVAMANAMGGRYWGEGGMRRPNTLRDTLIHNRMQYHGESIEDAIQWVNNEMKTFPQQPVDFADPAAFAESLGPGMEARMLGTGGNFVPSAPTAFDVGALQGETLSPEEIADLLAGGII